MDKQEKIFIALSVFLFLYLIIDSANRFALSRSVPPSCANPPNEQSLPILED